MKVIADFNFADLMNAFQDGINDLTEENRMLKAENAHLRAELMAADCCECEPEPTTNRTYVYRAVCPVEERFQKSCHWRCSQCPLSDDDINAIRNGKLPWWEGEDD